MPNKTNIEWTDYTSNPIAPAGGGWGCSKVSPGCDHCYAERLNKRMGNKRDFRGIWEFTLKQKELDALLRLSAGSKVFVGDMTDIFHPSVPWEFLIALFERMTQCSHITFQVLTKRPGRMAYFAEHVWSEYQNCHPVGPPAWPPNVWAGTSVESQKYVPRLDLLGQVPAKVRFVSYEPALGPVDLRKWLELRPRSDGGNSTSGLEPEQLCNWVIAGGESGPSARAAHPDWFRNLRDQCQVANTPFFFKQRGEWSWEEAIALEQEQTFEVPLTWRSQPGRYLFLNIDGTHGTGYDGLSGVFVAKVGKKLAGAVLDGREWREFPVP